MPRMDQVDVLVIGAGVVGLACARALALAGHDVLIVEREGAIGMGVSSRNSEVVHGGMYYPQGSLKARLCVQGRRMLQAYCDERGLPHRRCGKLIVASAPDEAPKLDVILARGRANGVEDLRLISGAEAREMEQALHCAAALHSPATGIVDSHALMTSLLGDAENAGALIALRSAFEGASRHASLGGRQWAFRTGGAEPFEMQARWIVNAAGLGAQAVARAVQGPARAAIPAQHLAKGNYFSLAAKSPFSHLIYPTPVDGGLGVHLTLDLGGQARFGPDVQWLAEGTEEPMLDYAVDPTRRAAFEAEIRRYWPGLPEAALLPAYSGVRPKLSGPGQAAADFMISGPQQHGCEGLVQLFGIESPGLTASMAIAEVVCKLVAAADQK